MDPGLRPAHSLAVDTYRRCRSASPINADGVSQARERSRRTSRSRSGQSSRSSDGPSRSGKSSPNEGSPTIVPSSSGAERACGPLLSPRLYHDFAAIAWDERVAPEFEEWAAELDISVFRVGQLVGDSAQDDDTDGDEVEVGLCLSVYNARRDVVGSLLTAFGNVSCLFASLWRSNDQPGDDVQETSPKS